MAKLDFWGALAAFLITAVASPVGIVGELGASLFFRGATPGLIAILKTSATAAGLVLAAGLFREEPAEVAERGGILSSAVSPARYIYGERRVPLQLVGAIDKTTENGDWFRALVLAYSEGETDGLEYLKVDGQDWDVPKPTVLPDGGLRYAFNAYLDIVAYTKGDGTQGQAIRRFSAERDFVLAGAFGANKPSELPGGDEPKPGDPFSVTRATTAPAASTSDPPAPSLELTWFGRTKEVVFRWRSTDPKIRRIEYQLVSADRAFDDFNVRIFSIDLEAGAQLFGEFRVDRQTVRGHVPLREDKDYKGRIRVVTGTPAPNDNRTSAWSETATVEPDNPDDSEEAHTAWTVDHRLYGISYLLLQIRQPRDENYWRSMPRIEVGVRGRKIVWPGQAVPTYTRNLVAIGYDIMRVQGTEAAAIDEPTIEAEYAHANVDLVLTPEERQLLIDRGFDDYAAESHIRYGGDLTLRSTDDMQAVWQSLLATMGEGARYVWDDKWFLEVGRPRKPIPYTITESDLQRIEFQPGPALTDRFNAVRLVLEQSAEHGYERKSIEVVDETARRDRDDGLVLVRDVGTLTTTTDYVAAHRYATNILNRGRANLLAFPQLRSRSDLRWMENLRPNRVVPFNLPTYGFSGENLLEGRVEKVAVMPDWAVHAEVIEETENIWTDSLIQPDYKHRPVGDPERQPAPVENLALTKHAYRFGSEVVRGVRANYDDDESGLPVRLRWRITRDPFGGAIAFPEWVYPPWALRLLFPGIVGARYEVQAQRGEPYGGYVSKWSASEFIDLVGDLDPPADPTGFKLTGIQGGYEASANDPRQVPDGATPAQIAAARAADVHKWEFFHAEADGDGKFPDNPPAGAYAGSSSGPHFTFTGFSEAKRVKVWCRAIDVEVNGDNGSNWVSAVVQTLRPGTSIGRHCDDCELLAYIIGSSLTVRLTWALPTADVPEFWRVQFGADLDGDDVEDILWGEIEDVPGANTERTVTFEGLSRTSFFIGKPVYARIQPLSGDNPGGAELARAIIESRASLGVPVLTAVRGDRRVVVSWPAVATATGYEGRQREANGAWGKWFTVTSPHTFGTLVNGTAYEFQVRAFRVSGGETTHGNAASITATPSAQPPPPPSDPTKVVASIAASATEVDPGDTVTLTASARVTNGVGATSYAFTQLTGQGNDISVSLSGSGASRTFTAPPNAGQGSRFARIQVEVTNNGVSSTARITIEIRTTAARADPPPAPARASGTATQASIGADIESTVTWSASRNPDAEWYQVERYQGSGLGWVSVGFVTSGTSLSHTIDVPSGFDANGHILTYRVLAARSNPSGGTNLLSGWTQFSVTASRTNA